MAAPGRDPGQLGRLVMATVVLLTWGFVLYGARVIAQRQLESGLFAPRLP